MKSAILSTVALLLGTAASQAALGTITAVASPPGPVAVNDLFTITLSISGYTDPKQIDAYQFQISYPSALFSFQGPFDHGTSAAGPNQQWLSMSAQEAAVDGYATPCYAYGPSELYL